MTHHPTNESIFDKDFAVNQVSGDIELMAELWSIFSEQSEELLAGIRQSLALNDAVGVRENAHALKGAVANFGAETSRDAARKLEFLGRSSNLDDAQRALTNLESELGKLSVAVGSFLSESGLSQDMKANS